MPKSCSLFMVAVALESGSLSLGFGTAPAALATPLPTRFHQEPKIDDLPMRQVEKVVVVKS